MDVSNYNKREKGKAKAKITSNEWEKLATILDVAIEDIYENEEATFIICKDQSVGVVNHGTNNVYTVPEFLLESQRKYIAKLEEENAQLKELLQ